MGRSRVAAVRCVSYDQAEVQAAVTRGFQLLGGIGDLVGPPRGSGRLGGGLGGETRETCLLKPNMLSPSEPSMAVTTHPAVVEAVGRVAAAIGIPLQVGDSPGRGDAQRAAEVSGVAEVCGRIGMALVLFDREVTVRHPSGFMCKEFTLAKEVVKAQTIVNMPKMKTHGLMTYTGAVKNLFGCIPGTLKAKMHLRYPEPGDFGVMLLDLLTLVKPAVSVLDAVVAMDGDGPSHGRARPFGAILMSPDAVALDTVALSLVNIDPMGVPYLRAARELGVGETRLREIEVVGDPVEGLAVHDFRLPASSGPSSLMRLGARMRSRITAVPVVDRNRCVGCGQCARSCPPQAISLVEGRASIGYPSCIRCYCCHELCPEGAIRLRKGGLARLTERVLDAFDRRQLR